jgi:hypothetical protein
LLRDELNPTGYDFKRNCYKEKEISFNMNMKIYNTKGKFEERILFLNTGLLSKLGYKDRSRVIHPGPWCRGEPECQNVLIKEGGVEFGTLTSNWELRDK